MSYINETYINETYINEMIGRSESFDYFYCQ